MSMQKPAEMYQGSDWLTYRWPVAQAFDTLDRIRDLCLQLPVAVPGELRPASLEPGYEVPDEEIGEVFGYIVELCDDLGGELDTVHADLYPVMQGNVAHLWTAFEMMLHLRDLRAEAVKESSTVETHTPPDAILTRAARIKALLKQIDQ
jgi:hypothetical protein